MPARNTKAGAQKWVIQRVKNIPGSGPPGGRPEYTRTWSIAISTITAPLTTSTDCILVVVEVLSTLFGEANVDVAMGVVIRSEEYQLQNLRI